MMGPARRTVRKSKIKVCNQCKFVNRKDSHDGSVWECLRAPIILALDGKVLSVRCKDKNEKGDCADYKSVV